MRRLVTAKNVITLQRATTKKGRQFFLEKKGDTAHPVAAPGDTTLVTPLRLSGNMSDYVTASQLCSEAFITECRLSNTQENIVYNSRVANLCTRNLSG